MKNLLIPIIILLTVFSSCHKEEILLDKKDVIDPATEIKDALFSGRIIHDENGVASAEIYIYQKGEKLGKVVSDQNGNYNTEGFKLKIGKDVTFEIKSEKFVTKIKRISIEQEIYKNIDFRLYNKPINNYTPIKLQNPGDTTLVKVYGTFTDINGNPITGASCVIIDNNDLPWNLIGYEITDENGYFEILVKQDVELYINSQLNCIENIIERSPNLKWNFFEIGKLYSDYEAIEKPDLQINNFKSELIGTFLNCDNTPVENGKLSAGLWIEDEFGKNVIEVFWIDFNPENGEFSISLNTCHENIYLIGLTFWNLNGQVYQIDVPYSEGQIDFGTILACTHIKSAHLSVMSIKVGDIYSNDSIQVIDKNSLVDYDIVGLDLYGLIPITENNYGDIELIINEEITYGFHEMSLFDCSKFDWGFKSTNGEITAEITGAYDNYVIGTFSGEVETINYGKQTVTGSFRCPYDK